MTTQDDIYVKILFCFHSYVLDEEPVETMWATIVDKNKGLYKLDSIPFYAPLVASARSAGPPLADTILRVRQTHPPS